MRKNTIILQFLSICAALFILSSCEIQEDFKYQPSGGDGKLEMSAWEYIQQNDSLSYLKQAINYAGLEDMYHSTEAYTFITPTNQSFKEYLKSNNYGQIEDIPIPILRNVLKYHVVQKPVNFTNPELMPSNKPIGYLTENGQTMYLSHKSNFVGLINEGTNKQWEIATSNLEPNNGVIHVVNAIVYFSAPTTQIGTIDPSIMRDTIYALHDTYVNGGGQAGTNFGNEELLLLKNVSGNGDYDRKPFLMFDFSDFTKEGVVTNMNLELAVKFTHAKNVRMDLYNTPDETWTEGSLNFNNAVFSTEPPIASITTKKVSTFEFNITDFYKDNINKTKVSFMLEGEAGKDETNEFASKEHSSLNPPMLIATLASGESALEWKANEKVSVNRGEVVVFDNDILELTGASSTDIIYTIEKAPENGWFLKGASSLRKGDKFTQQDIELMNLLYIHNGESNSSDLIVLTARDLAGSVIEDIQVEINVN